MENSIKIVLLLSFSLGFSQNNLLQSGPMVGYCEMKEAVIWLQAKENTSVKIEYFAVDNPAKVFTSDNYNSSKENGLDGVSSFFYDSTILKSAMNGILLKTFIEKIHLQV